MVGTPTSLETVRTVEYRLAVDFQLNEVPGKLRPLAGSTGSYSDKMAQIEDRFEDLVVAEITTRNADTVNTDIGVERRFIPKPRRQNVAPLIDRDDMLATKIDLQSPIARQTARAIRRAHDDRVLQGFYGNAYTGESGGTAVPFKAANILAVDYSTAGTSTGLTKNKLIGAMELIRTRLVDVEAEKPIVLITAKQVSDLLKINEVTSRDYNPGLVQALQSGQPGDFMGFRFVMTEYGNATPYPGSYSLSDAGGGIRRVPIFVPSGMHVGVWEEFYGEIGPRADKNHSTQIYGETCVGAVRVNEDKCFQVLCLES